MKKKIKIILIIIFIIMLIPIKTKLWDGGTIIYKSILYEFRKVHKINHASKTGYEEGIKIKILGYEIYNNVKTLWQISKTFR